jgi:hypothetical protein
MDYKNKSIIVSALIIGLGILFSNGIYRYHSVDAIIVQRYNIFTGSIDLCMKGRGCIELDTKKE